MEEVTRKRDPMFELFIEEMNGLMESLEEQLKSAKKEHQYDKDMINEIFRIIHTIKADATMMLIESIAAPARALERILYFYRDENGCKVSYSDFTGIIEELVSFYYDELEECNAVGRTDGDGEEYVKKYDEFLEKLKKEEGKEDLSTIHQEEEPFRFYIASKTVSTDDDAQIARKVSIQKAEAAGHDFVKRIKAANVTADDVKQLVEIIERADYLNERLIELYSDNDEVQDLIYELDNLNGSIHSWFESVYMSRMSHITVKLKAIVEEMNRSLGKNVKINIEGDNNLIEKVNIEKISSSLIHLIRNSIDHGIESSEVRERLGKDKNGNIFVKYCLSKDLKGLCLEYSDDGCGLDPDEILCTALNKGIISGDEEIPDDNWIYNLIMQPGYTTTVNANEYSGRGVGMDAVKHNIADIGGKIEISSKINEGTKFNIYIPYMVEIPGIKRGI